MSELSEYLGIPEINNWEDYDSLPDGVKYLSDGEVITKGRPQRKGVSAPDQPEWSYQDEIINMFLGGYGDEVRGAMDFLAGKVVPGGDDSTLAETQEQYRQAQKVFRETHPAGAAAAQLVGGLVPTGQAAKVAQTITKAAPILQKVPRYVRDVAGAAAQSALFGSGEADPNQRLKGAKEGAYTGAAVTATVDPLLAASGFIGRAIRARFNPQQSAKNVVNQVLLQSNLSPRETATPQEIAQLPAHLRDLPPHLRRAARRIGQLGPEGTLADAAPGLSARALAHTASRFAGPGRQRVEGLLSDRAAGEQSRLIDTVDITISPSYDDIDLRNQLVTSATPFYREAFDSDRGEGGEPQTVNQDLMSLPIIKVLSSPNGRRAFKAAIAQMENEFSWDKRMGRDATRILDVILENSPRDVRGVIESIPENAPGLTLEFLDKVKIQLQEMGERFAKSENRRSDARVVKGQAATLVNELDRLDDTKGVYATARQTAESKFKLDKAFKAGLLALGPKGSVENIRKLMAGLTEGEKAMYRAGAANYLRTKIHRVPDGGNPARSVFGNSAVMNKLAAVIDDKENLAAFKKAITREKAFGLTQRTVLGGGVPRLEETATGKEAVGTTAAVAGTAISPFNPLVVAGQFRKLGQRLMGARSDEEAVKLLLTRDEEENRKTLAALARLPSDPDRVRLRDILSRAIAQQVETKRERWQVPDGDGQYRLQDFNRTLLNPMLYGQVLSHILNRGRNAEGKEND
jgi:hypothetical protein